MTGHGSKFGHKKKDAIAPVTFTAPCRRSCPPGGIGTKTLYRWLRIPKFQDAHGEARREAYSQSITRPHPASSAAVSTLLKIMGHPNAPAVSRVRVVDRVSEHTAKAIETDDIGARVLELYEPCPGSTSSGAGCAAKERFLQVHPIGRRNLSANQGAQA